MLEHLVISRRVKQTSIGLYTNFTAFSYKTEPIKTLIHQTYKIGSFWNLLNDEIYELKHFFEKNMYPPYLTVKHIKSFLNNTFSNNDTSNENFNEKHNSHYKLPYISDIFISTKKKMGELCKRFCKNMDINFALSPFKISSLFSYRDRLPDALKSFVVYKFTSAGFQSHYTGNDMPLSNKQHILQFSNIW